MLGYAEAKLEHLGKWRLFWVNLIKLDLNCFKAHTLNANK